MLRAIVLLALLAGPAGAQEALERVDLELVLLADASGSIDQDEVRFQRQGYAEAMRHPEVLWAIENGGAEGRIAVTFVEWASAGSQEVVVDWMVVEDEASAVAFGERLLAAPRMAFGSNALGAALMAGLEMIEGNRYDGFRKVIDLSGDSSWNPQGPPLTVARDLVVAEGITINGLAILCGGGCSGRPRLEDLEAEYTERLIGGMGAFVVTADGPENFYRAVRQKLILEIADLGGGPRWD